MLQRYAERPTCYKGMPKDLNVTEVCRKTLNVTEVCRKTYMLQRYVERPTRAYVEPDCSTIVQILSVDVNFLKLITFISFRVNIFIDRVYTR